MSSTFKRLGQSELLPRYIFAESLVARRRVLEIGAVASTLGQSAKFLSTRGARMVVAADADVAAVQEAQARLAGPNLRFRANVFDDFETGSFDLVIVSDLAPYVRAPELMKDVARLVAKSGYLMGGLRNPAGLSLAMVLDPEEQEAQPTYGQLLDVLQPLFPSVDVATQSPVLGYQLAFERGEGLQVDGSLAGSSEAAYYVVLAGHEEIRNFDPTWVQLPPEPLAFTGGRLEEFSTRARDWRDRSERLKEILQKKTVELDSRQLELGEAKQQLEASHEAVSRLTVQLESIRERPDVVRDREDLATRVRQMEAELQVSRERAIDAEGRVTATRAELEALQRQQKDSAVSALAAQESMRLERARREELGSQLEDSRLRLAKAYEDLRRTQDEGAAERVEHERSKISIERLKEAIAQHERNIEESKQRELRLADARTEALKAIEGLETSFSDARRQLSEARESVEQKEAERYSAIRTSDVERQARAGVEAELQRETARGAQLARERSDRSQEKIALETELAALTATRERLESELSSTQGSEARWREAAGDHERRLNETTQELQRFTERTHGLERDVAELRADLQTSRERVLALEAALAESRNIVEQLNGRVGEQTAQLRALESTRDSLDNELQATRTRLETTSASLDAAQRELELRGGTLGEQQQRIVELESARTSLESDLHGSRERLASTASSLESAQRELDLRGAALGVQERRSEELESALHQTEARLREVQDDRDALVGERDDLRNALSDVEKVRAEQGARLTEVSERAESLAGRLSQVEGELAAVRSELQRATTDASAQEKSLRGVLADRETALEEERVARRDAELIRDVAQSTLAEVEPALASTREQLAESSSALASTRESLARMTAAQAESQRAREEAEANVLWLEPELATARAELARLDDALAQTRQTLASTTESRELLDLERVDLEKRYASLERDARLAGDRAAELENTVRALNAELREAEEKATEAQGELQNRVDGLQFRLDAAQESVRTTRSLLEGSEAALQQSRTASESLIAERDQLASDGREAQLRIERLQHESADLRQQVETIEPKLGELIATNDANLSALIDTRARLDVASAELSNARESVARLEVEVTELRSRSTSAETARDERKAQVERLEGLLAEREAGIENSTSRIVKLEQEKTILSSSLAAAMSEAEHVRAELEETLEARFAERELREKAELETARATEQNAVHRSDLDQRTSRIDALEAELRELQAQLTAQLEASRQELDANREASRRALDDKHEETEKKLQALREEQQRSTEQQQAAFQESLDRHATEAKSAADAAAEKHATELQNERERATALEQERVGAQTALQALTDQAERLRVEANEARESYEQQLRDHRTQAERAQSEARGHQAQKLSMQQELEALRGELTTLRGSLQESSAREQLEAETERLRQRIPELEGEVAALRDLQPELAQLRERLPTLETQLTQSVAEASALSASERELKRQLTELDLALAQARTHEAELEAATVQHHHAERALKAEQELTTGLQAELDRLREARVADEDVTLELRNRTAMLEAQLAEAQRPAPQGEEEVGLLRRRLPELEAELEISRVNARNDVDAAQLARQQAEDMLLALRVKYGELQHDLTRSWEDLTEARAETELLEAERERLAARIETMERSTPAPLVIPAIADDRKLVPPLVEKPVEVFELDVDDGAEEIILLEEETPGTRGRR